MSSINRKFFFDYVRHALFGGSLNQSQVNGLEALLDSWEEKHSEQDDRWLAYVLATAYHEVDRTMQPIEEYGKGKGHPYGRPDPATGKVYYGRGFVQLTWKDNYEKLGDKIGVDLVNHPEMALELDVAAKIIFTGMIDGDFTGKKLSDYLNPRSEDWVHARRIVNGLDRADDIAEYAKKFYAATSYTTVSA